MLGNVGNRGTYLDEWKEDKQTFAELQINKTFRYPGISSQDDSYFSVQSIVSNMRVCNFKL